METRKGWKPHFEDQSRVGGDDGRESTSTVGVVRGAGELGLKDEPELASLDPWRRFREKPTFCPSESWGTPSSHPLMT